MGLPLKHFLRAIDRGEYNHRLDEVEEKVVQFIQEQRQVVALEVVASLKEGDLVRVKRGKSKDARPKFLGGRTGRVVGTKGALVEIEYDKVIKRPSRTYKRGFVSGLYVEKL